MTFRRLASILRQGAALASVIVGAVVSSSTLPTSVRTVLVALGGVLLTVEHYVADPSTGGGTPGPKGAP